MHRKSLTLRVMTWAFVLIALTWGVDQALAAKTAPKKDKNKITQKDRELSAAKAIQKGKLNPLMVDMPAMPAMPG